MWGLTCATALIAGLVGYFVPRYTFIAALSWPAVRGAAADHPLAVALFLASWGTGLVGAILWLSRRVGDRLWALECDRALAEGLLQRRLDKARAPLDALLEADEALISSVDVDRSSLRRWRHLFSVLLGLLLVTVTALLMGATALSGAEPHWASRFGLWGLAALPLLVWSLRLASPLEANALVALHFAGAAFCAVLVALKPAFATTVAGWRTLAGCLILHTVVFVVLLWREGTWRCLLLSTRGLRLVSIRGRSVKVLRGPFEAATLVCRPGLWTLAAVDGELLQVVPGETKGAAFAEACARAGASVTRRDEPRGLGRLPVVVAVTHGIVALSLATFLVHYGLSLGLTVVPFVTPALGENPAGPEALEQACRRVLGAHPTSAVCLAFLGAALHGQDRYEDAARVSERLERAKLECAIESFWTSSSTGKTHVDLRRSVGRMTRLLARPRRGWEPRGAGLRPFRIAMAHALAYRKNLTGRWVLDRDVASLREAMALDPEAPGPRAMLAWLAFRRPGAVVEGWAEAGAPPLDASAALAGLHRAAERFEPLRKIVAPLATRPGWTELPQRIDGALPAACAATLRRALTAPSAAGVDGWRAVCVAAGTFRFIPPPGNLDFEAFDRVDGRHPMQNLLLEPPETDEDFSRAWPESRAGPVDWTALLSRD